ncbi:TT-ORF1 multi-domain protein [Pyrenophora tritici-repentis]|uniref:TT-ORF1 multi-domain protein n=2 Tax=Pyrenophora tritici-repentis TaxID=45151 RepID=A0A834S6K6_9PLEO|nr:uncharacterized protein PTRG_02517 [Pyrenophora tritici-repentis Pt-1C-BFP]KAF7574442.1 TT-ORF1 multi-domain protein [Pyrenophora tritici-repentis]EDU45040.1 predicted protein [Pyrenophora tritici-repentis Pt-1C-BFP]KAI1518517.1 hypothetical protein Ptr86124_001645 [Pyrenophora tritici-repentis]KAI1672084.1 hypothetical protein L13192_02943 [Pyrenophora tritici-repentis]KAI1686092.1 hypothetical protein KJE20_04057 [Pyrenophora tritici-repentis]
MPGGGGRGGGEAGGEGASGGGGRGRGSESGSSSGIDGLGTYNEIARESNGQISSPAIAGIVIGTIIGLLFSIYLIRRYRNLSINNPQPYATRKRGKRPDVEEAPPMIDRATMPSVPKPVALDGGGGRVAT